MPNSTDSESITLHRGETRDSPEFIVFRTPSTATERRGQSRGTSAESNGGDGASFFYNASG
jgi:hypothetical protein